MIRFPSATLVREGRENMRDMSEDCDDSVRDAVRQNGSVLDRIDFSQDTEAELREYLEAMAAGGAARLPVRPDLGFRYQVKAFPPSVRMSIMPSRIVGKHTTEPQAHEIAIVKQVTGRRPLPTIESFQFLGIHQVDSETPVGQSSTNSIASSSDDSDNDYEYEYGTVIQDRLNEERVDPSATSRHATVPNDNSYDEHRIVLQPRQNGRMVLSTSSSDDDDEAGIALPQARQAGERMMLSGSSIVYEDEDEVMIMAHPATHRRALSIGSDFLPGSSVETRDVVAMARPVSHRRALSVDFDSSSVDSAASSRESHADEQPVVDHDPSLRVDSPMVFAQMDLGVCFQAKLHGGHPIKSYRAEHIDHDVAVIDETPDWLGIHPECAVMLFASPSEGCMARFAHLWEDEYAEAIDESLFADFDEVLSDVVSDGSSDDCRSFWSMCDDGDTTQTSRTSTKSRRNSWSTGDEFEYHSAFVAESVQRDFIHQHHEQLKARHSRRTFDEFYRFKKGGTMSTVRNGW
ncbi:hypothetical protein HBH69_233140 [Parastagonospora nodorum]|nr:hypothetical protein HBH49_119740 [Parastagonospora nodorum]KAH5136909.1 hypothetical protein HBH69_233140 [Parastagonospora nodorum]KAH5438286.1 hypothetical protein HBI32_013220 [Parastagonospora nodorum]KAH6191306.1 hypothetical protein HBI53_226780 [Parastagonospora nodorum]